MSNKYKKTEAKRRANKAKKAAQKAMSDNERLKELKDGTFDEKAAKRNHTATFSEPETSVEPVVDSKSATPETKAGIEPISEPLSRKDIFCAIIFAVVVLTLSLTSAFYFAYRDDSHTESESSTNYIEHAVEGTGTTASNEFNQ